MKQTKLDFAKLSKEFAQEAKKKLGRKLISLVLYGSVSRGKATAGSDVDIFAVVADKKTKDALFEIGFQIELKYGVMLSIVARTLKELSVMRGMGSLYFKEVKKKGKVLYGEKIH